MAKPWVEGIDLATNWCSGATGTAAVSDDCATDFYSSDWLYDPTDSHTAGSGLTQSLDLAALLDDSWADKEHGRHLVGFVDNHEIPAAIGSRELRLDCFIAGQLIQTGDDQVALKIRRPAMMVLPAAGSSVSRKRRGWRGSIAS